mmetsp:Transcript_11502/g.47844  ORF Transcript_11502/g.47844 Transcript_11502/m.47844 type:complete len:222 (-) Transcript_11502:60-725(-)
MEDTNRRFSSTSACRDFLPSSRYRDMVSTSVFLIFATSNNVGSRPVDSHRDRLSFSIASIFWTAIVSSASRGTSFEFSSVRRMIGFVLGLSSCLCCRLEIFLLPLPILAAAQTTNPILRSPLPLSSREGISPNQNRRNRPSQKNSSHSPPLVFGRTVCPFHDQSKRNFHSRKALPSSAKKETTASATFSLYRCPLFGRPPYLNQIFYLPRRLVLKFSQNPL